MRRFRSIGTIVGVLVVGALVLAACSSSSSPSSSSGSSGTKQAGGVATYAEQPDTIPTYIFPFMSLAFFSVVNTEQFQYLMYRPLYWFGQGDSPDLSSSLSLAQPPTYSNGNTTVTIDLKNYKWSNGETLTSYDVLFWMNMMHAEKANWAAYAPGYFPDNVKSITIDSPTQLTMTFNQAYNTYWFTYNELSQITPLPMAWDITSAGAAPNSGGCAKAAYGTADAACAAVYTFLSKEAGFDPSNPSATNNSYSTYATNPIWQIVDGPWHLKAFDSSGDVTMVPNPTYSGPVKATLSEFREVPFTTDSAEYNSLVAGDLTFGYLPPSDVTQSTSNALVAGPNSSRLAGNFNLDPLYTWSINYFPYNFNASGGANSAAGAIFSQLYVRQAIQYLVDQPLYIQKIFHGYAVPTYGPVPIVPSNSFASAYEKSNPYPYNSTKAVDLLKSHGWHVVPNGTSTCTRPGTGADECGANIPSGAKLSFDLQYASGLTSTEELMTTEKSAWALAGININLSEASFATVTGNSTPCSPGPSCTWEFENWGAGWVYSPDYYPTGEEIFETGAGSNSGSYSNATNDQNIKETNLTNVSLDQYQNFLADNLPVVYQPDFVSELSEVSKNLQGTTPQNVLWAITPENWYFTK